MYNDDYIQINIIMWGGRVIKNFNKRLNQIEEEGK